MNDLIKITKSSINGVEVNSINARELHKILEVKKAFTSWIVASLNMSGAIENEDYIKLKSSLEGSGYKYDYIISTDLSKHISMMSKVPKAREVRDYFIEVEKQYNKPLSITDQIVLIAQGHQEQQKRLDVLEHKVDNEITLTSAQKYHLKNSVSKKVYSIKEDNNFSKDFIKKGHFKIWKILKNKYVVSTYMDIPKVNFDECCTIVNHISIEDLI